MQLALNSINNFLVQIINFIPKDNKTIVVVKIIVKAFDIKITINMAIRHNSLENFIIFELIIIAVENFIAVVSTIEEVINNFAKVVDN